MAVLGICSISRGVGNVLSLIVGILFLVLVAYATYETDKYFVDKSRRGK